jgi:hypothetical protein
MKKITPTIIKSIFLFLSTTIFSQFTAAQNSKVGFTVKTNCLEVYAQPYYLDSNCESVEWWIDTSLYARTDNFSHKFKTAGTYSLCMKLKNSCKKWDTTICQKVTVTTCPCDTTKISMKIVKDTVTCGEYKMYASPASSSSQKYSYSWNFGDGTSSTSYDPIKQYKSNGSYTPCLEVKWTLPNTNNTCTRKVCDKITVSCSSANTKCDLSRAKISYSNKCNSFTFEATNFSDSCVKTYWLIDSVKYFGRLANVKFNYKGTYDVCMYVVNSCYKCDTMICTTVKNECLPSCDWSKTNVGMGYTKSKTCGEVVFEANNLQDTCISYEFIYGGQAINKGRLTTHKFTKNGNYKVGYRFYNRCTGCDTTVWKEVEIGCFETKKCTWPSNLGFTVKLVECPYIRVTMNEFDMADSCYTYKVVVNNSEATQSKDNPGIFNYKLPKNGKYSICVYFKNWCTGCDTLLCKDFSTDCIKTTTKCNWRNAGFEYSSKCRSYLFEAYNLDDTCNRYQFKITKGNSSTWLTPGRVQDYKFPSNGYYNVCLKIMNSCKNCDTIICKTVYVNCTDSTVKCNWKNPGFGVSGDCTKTFEANNQNNTNVKYQWVFLYSIGTTYGDGRIVKHKFSKSGTYTVVLKYIDTLTGCDTIIYKTVTVKCTTAGISASDLQAVTVYPNPGTESFEIQSNQPSTSVTCYTNMGQLVFSGDVKSGEKVNCAQWPAGIYTIKIQTESGIVYRRFVKQL